MFQRKAYLKFLTWFVLATFAFSAVEIGKSIGAWINAKAMESALTGVKELIASDAETMVQLKRADQERLDATAAADRARIQWAREASKEALKDYNKAMDDARAENGRLLKKLRADADEVIGAYSELSTAIKQEIENTERSRQESIDRVKSLENEQRELNRDMDGRQRAK